MSRSTNYWVNNGKSLPAFVLFMLVKIQRLLLDDTQCDSFAIARKKWSAKNNREAREGISCLWLIPSLFFATWLIYGSEDPDIDGSFCSFRKTLQYFITIRAKDPAQWYPSEPKANLIVFAAGFRLALLLGETGITVLYFRVICSPSE